MTHQVLIGSPGTCCYSSDPLPVVSHHLYCQLAKPTLLFFTVAAPIHSALACVSVCRSYLLRAITAHGGFGAVAMQIGWDMAYTPKRPKGYWNSILNVKSEIDDFIHANGLQPGIVPSLRDVRGADR